MVILADIYCYTCDDSKVDPELPRHLKHFGMDVVNQQKTDKSMTELVSLRETVKIHKNPARA